MMKLKFVPTGNIFVLPDEEAIKIKNKDRGNYVLLSEDDKEIVEEKKEVKVPTIKELVMPEEQTEPMTNEEIAKDITLEELAGMDRFALFGLAQRLDLKPATSANKRTLLKMLKETGIFK